VYPEKGVELFRCDGVLAAHSILADFRVLEELRCNALGREYGIRWPVMMAASGMLLNSAALRILNENHSA
jgi:hypothetical protein